MKHLRHYQGCFDNSNASVGFSTAALYKRYCDAFLSIRYELVAKWPHHHSKNSNVFI